MRLASGAVPDSTGCNYIESLSGIETPYQQMDTRGIRTSCNYIESLSGIETHCLNPRLFATAPGCNYIESLSGIETSQR